MVDRFGSKTLIFEGAYRVTGSDFHFGESAEEEVTSEPFVGGRPV